WEKLHTVARSEAGYGRRGVYRPRLQSVHASPAAHAHPAEEAHREVAHHRVPVDGVQGRHVGRQKNGRDNDDQCAKEYGPRPGPGTCRIYKQTVLPLPLYFALVQAQERGQNEQRSEEHPTGQGERQLTFYGRQSKRSEERRVGKECRSRWAKEK